jgi:hypothetical protein
VRPRLSCEASRKCHWIGHRPAEVTQQDARFTARRTGPIVDARVRSTVKWVARLSYSDAYDTSLNRPR